MRIACLLDKHCKDAEFRKPKEGRASLSLPGYASGARG
jgi:hypothetical protein